MKVFQLLEVPKSHPGAGVNAQKTATLEKKKLEQKRIVFPNPFSLSPRSLEKLREN